MNQNIYQSYKTYSRIQQQTYNNNQILSYVEQVLQKSRINYKQLESNIKPNLNQQNINNNPNNKSIINLSKIIPQELKITQKQDITLQKTIPHINHNKIQIDNHQLHLCQTQKNSLNKTFQQQTPSKINQERFKNFKIIKKLGDDKYSEVFLARHLQTGFLVALKVIKKKQMIEEIMEAQLTWEIKIQYLFDHPIIFTLFLVETEIFLVLEYSSHCQLLNLYLKQPNQRFQEKEASNYVHTFALMLFIQILNQIIFSYVLVNLHGKSINKNQ